MASELPFIVTVDDKGARVVVKRFGDDVVKTSKRSSRAFEKTQKEFTRTQRALKGVGAAMKAVGVAALVLGATAVAARALTADFASFEAQMNRVGALTGATEKQFKSLTDQAKKLGATTKFSATEAANAMAFLGQAGFDTNEILGALPGTLELAAAAALDLASAADIVSNVLSGLQIPVRDLGRVNDVLVKTFISTNVNLLQLGESFKFVGPILASAGVEFEEAAAAIGLMGNAGIQGSMAGTALRASISRLLNPSAEAAEILASLGVSATDSAGNLRSLATIIGQLERAGTSTAEIMTIFGDRAGPALASLIAEGEEGLKKLTKELRNSGGTAEKIAKEQMKGLEGSIKTLKSAAEGLAITVGETLAPALQTAAGILTIFSIGLTEAINNMTGTVDASRALEAQLKANDNELKRNSRNLQSLLDQLLLLGKFGETSGERVEGLRKKAQALALTMRILKATQDKLLQQYKDDIPAATKIAGKALTEVAKTAKEAAAEVAAALALQERQTLIFTNRVNTAVLESQRKAADAAIEEQRRAGLASIEVLKENRRMELIVVGESLEARAAIERRFATLIAEEADRIQGEGLNSLKSGRATFTNDQGQLEEVAFAEGMNRRGRDAEETRRLERQKGKVLLSGSTKLFKDLQAASISGTSGLFKISKAFAVADATVNAFASFNAALKNPPGPPFTIPLAAAALIQGLAQVKSIKSATLGGGGGGGAPGGGGGAAAAPPEPGVPPVVPSVPEVGEGGRPQINVDVSVQGFVGDEANLASQLGEVFREAVGDDVEFGQINVSR